MADLLSTEAVFGVSQPGDPDYPLKTLEGSAGCIGEIRKRCNKETPYEDPDFPATAASIGEAKGDSANESEDGVAAKSYVWLRPHEICAEQGHGKPLFVGEDGEPSDLDVRQMGLGDCWYLAALAAMVSNRAQFDVVVPRDNYTALDDDKYTGAFHFRFYEMAAGKFVDIVVDDRIPCAADSRKPAFAQVQVACGGDKRIRFWPALIEKAFAKYRGGFTAIEGGNTATAYVYFTGGFSGWFQMKDYRNAAQEKYEELVKNIKSYLRSGGYMGCSPGGKSAAAETGFEAMGLVATHAYAVLNGVEISEKDAPERTHLLLRLKNPWAHHEWNGPLCDTDDEGWAALEQDLRPRNAEGSSKVDEGAFWIDLRDIIKYCSSLSYCLFGFGDGTKFCSIRSEWPAELQQTEVDTGTSACTKFGIPFTFDVRIELPIARPKEHEGKSIACMRIVAGEVGVPLDPAPFFFAFVGEIPEDSDLTDVHKHIDNKFGEWYSNSQDGMLNAIGLYLKPGRYFVNVVLKSGPNVPVPDAYVGKPIPFTISLYTENVTSLAPFTNVDDGRKVSTLRCEWPAEQQEKEVNALSSGSFDFGVASTFEVKRALPGIKLPAGKEDTCLAMVKVTVGEEGGTLDPIPLVSSFVYAIPDGADVSSLRQYISGLGLTYQANQYGSMDLGDGYLKPGRYLVNCMLQTGAGASIPSAYVGKPVPFSVTVTSENDAAVTPVVA